MRSPRLLVHSYFCPADDHRPGGTQVVLGPLLAMLAERHGWEVRVCHPTCCSVPGHAPLPDPTPPSQPDAVDPAAAVAAAEMFRVLAGDVDVVLSIDRELPARWEPAVLVSNTSSYRTELTALRAGGWAAVVVPSATYGRHVHALEPSLPVVPIGYGFTEEYLAAATRAPAVLRRPAGRVRVRFAHRPDPRKGHVAMVLGLRGFADVVVELSWLDEPRYDSFRDDLRVAIDGAGVADQVAFAPWSTRAEHVRAPGEHASVHVGAFQETFGLSIIESCLLGRPALVHHQPAASEVLGDHPLLVEVRDVSRWPVSLLERWEEPLSVAAVEEGRQGLRARLSLARAAARYDALLREVAGGNQVSTSSPATMSSAFE